MEIIDNNIVHDILKLYKQFWWKLFRFSYNKWDINIYYNDENNNKIGFQNINFYQLVFHDDFLNILIEILLEYTNYINTQSYTKIDKDELIIDIAIRINNWTLWNFFENIFKEIDKKNPKEELIFSQTKLLKEKIILNKRTMSNFSNEEKEKVLDIILSIKDSNYKKFGLLVNFIKNNNNFTQNIIEKIFTYYKNKKLNNSFDTFIDCNEFYWWPWKNYYSQYDIWLIKLLNNNLFKENLNNYKEVFNDYFNEFEKNEYLKDHVDYLNKK